MRRSLVPLLLVTSLVGVHAEAGPDLRIAELLPDPGNGREFIELWNAGDVSQPLAGWSIEDAAGNAFAFTDQVLGPGQRLVVWGGGDATPHGPAWSKATVWNNGGDTATLRDDAGNAMDVLTYGPGGESVPATGQALAWEGSWAHAEPTPGQGPGESGGTITANVSNLPPDVSLDAPSRVAPNAQVPVAFTVHDANGGALNWTLFADDTVVRQGQTDGRFEQSVQAPGNGHVLLRLQATDGRHHVNATHRMDVSAAALEVGLPASGIRFPALEPGATQVLADAPFWLNNTGTASAAPRIDLSDFVGPGRIDVVGNVSLRWGEGAWITYDGPLTPLPQIAAGDGVPVWLRLDRVPEPLPAGEYGTSFTVVL